MTSIRTRSIRIAIAAALAAGAALAGAAAAHHAESISHGGAVTAFVRPGDINDCCE
jgi:ABC-type sugar transport system substrate-binding protein